MEKTIPPVVEGETPTVTTPTPVVSEDKNKTSSNAKVPSIKELLKAGVQFGHEAKRWNPKMKKYIFGVKNNIHIIDINQTERKLEEAANFLRTASEKGKVLFIGTKRQASDIVKNEAIRAGAYFIDIRWAGGLLTNFSIVKRSLNKLNSLEKGFEEGIEGRTKYEVSVMKKEWERLNRLYSGIKTLSERPTAIVVLDVNYEKSAIRECRKLNLPIVGIVDTNSDPDNADYVIPANDDAIGSIKTLVGALADAVLDGNKGNGVKHELKDYSIMDVKIISTKDSEPEEKETVLIESIQPDVAVENRSKEPEQVNRSKNKSKGILERVQENTESKKKTSNKVEEKPVAKKIEKKSEEVVETKTEKPAALKKKETATKSTSKTKSK